MARVRHLLKVTLACLAASATIGATVAGAQTAGSLDPGFAGPPVSDPEVNSVAVQVDGKVIVTGPFLGFGGIAAPFVTRLNSDGTVDSSFTPNVNDFGTSSKVQADGRIVITGGFTSVGGQPRNRVARLNPDGTLDSGFSNPNANHVVWSSAFQPNGKIVITGAFTSVGGQPRNRVARLNVDGTLDTGFSNPNANSEVSAAAVQPDGKVVIVGIFTSVGGQPRNRVARLNADGTLDTSFVDPNVSASVSSVAVQSDGKILVGGGFTSVGGQRRDRVARLNSDGTLDSSFEPVFDNAVSTVVLQADGKILVGGAFTRVGGLEDGQPRGRVARLNTNGTLDTSFSNPIVNDWVSSAAVQPDGKIVIGGSFTEVGGQTRNRVARLFGSDSNPENPDPPDPVPACPSPPGSGPCPLPLVTWPKDLTWSKSFSEKRVRKARSARIRLALSLPKGQSLEAGHELALVCEKNCGRRGAVLGKLRNRKLGRSSKGRPAPSRWVAQFTRAYKGPVTFRVVVTAAGRRGASQAATYRFRASKSGRKGAVLGPDRVGGRVCLEPGSTTVETSCAG